MFVLDLATWSKELSAAGSGQSCSVLTTCRGQASLSSAVCHTSHFKTYGLETTYPAVQPRIWTLLPVGRRVTVTRCYKQVLSCGNSLTESWFWTCGSCGARYISVVSRSDNCRAKVWVPTADGYWMLSRRTEIGTRSWTLGFRISVVYFSFI
jgi:hypothetical protein